MIDSKKELREYLYADKIALGKMEKRRPRFLGDDIWKFQIVLRKYEYFYNVKKRSIAYYYYLYKYHRLSNKYCYFIPPNVFDKGLSIAHKGVIVVHPNAKVGKYCRIQEMVNIGATNGSDKAAQIGDYCFLGSGAKIIGEITIPDFVAIGANAVVVKSISEEHTTWGGIPAKKISENDSVMNLCKHIFDLRENDDG